MTKEGKGSGFISRNNNDETAKNFFEVNEKAGIPRKETITWNIVPWYIGKDGRRRTPSTTDIQLGLEYLYRLIDRLPHLQVIVLVGKKAQSVERHLKARFPLVRVLRCSHPSPLFVNNKPGNKRKIVVALRRVRNAVNATP